MTLVADLVLLVGLFFIAKPTQIESPAQAARLLHAVTRLGQI